MFPLEKAIRIAVEAHKGQTDKAGAPYISHPLRLMLGMDTEDEKIVAVLHDVVEDSDWTIDALREEGFSEIVLAAIDSVTRRDDESYEEFVDRAGRNLLARKVKIADLKDNMDITRIDHPTDKDFDRIKKYHKAWSYLKKAKQFEVVLRSRKSAGGDSSELKAYLSGDGTLNLDGYDCGQLANALVGRSEYEYWVSVGKADVPQVLLELIHDRFDRNSEFREWLKSKGIESEFFTYP